MSRPRPDGLANRTAVGHGERVSQLRSEMEQQRSREYQLPVAMPTRNALSRWWCGIGNWFSFVNRRRIDARFPVFPEFLRVAEFLAIFLFVLALVLFFVDPFYLEAVRDEEWAPRRIFEITTELGRSGWVLYPSGTALILYSLFRPGAMVSRSAHIAHTMMLAVYYIFTTVAFSGLIANALKNLIGRARPEYVTSGEVWESFPLRDTFEFASFPSGHATTAGALALGLALLFPRIRIFFLLGGIWIAISRPAVGVHFPSDIFAGFCLGGAFSYVYARAFARKRLLFAFDNSGFILPRFRVNRFSWPHSGA